MAYQMQASFVPALTVHGGGDWGWGEGRRAQPTVYKPTQAVFSPDTVLFNCLFFLQGLLIEPQI